MYKIKNVTNEKILFIDRKGNRIMIDPGKEIENEHGTNMGFGKKLVIEEIKGIEKNKKQEVKKDGNA